MLQQKNEKIKALEQEVSVMDELQSVVKILRQDLANERNQSTEQELLIHDQSNKIEYLKR